MDNILRNIASNEPYAFTTAYVNKVWNPRIRYTLRLLANTIFAMKKSKIVIPMELMLLNQAIKWHMPDQEGKKHFWRA